MTSTRPIVLASVSPRRRQLLEHLGLQFEVLDSDVDEDAIQTPDAAQLALWRAQAKGRAVAALRPEALVIAADTVVAVDGLQLGKPRDEAEAVEMLGRLAGRAHTVHTGVYVCGGGREETAVETTLVTMRPLALAEREAYVQTGEPMDKAGAYGIQGFGATLVTRIEGCFYSVMGLPLARLTQMLARFDIHVLASRPQPARPVR